jgi:hypothetical protein
VVHIADLMADSVGVVLLERRLGLFVTRLRWLRRLDLGDDTGAITARTHNEGIWLVGLRLLDLWHGRGLDLDLVGHHGLQDHALDLVEGSWFPNRSGAEQKRIIASLTADELKYTSPATATGTTAEATWKRAK